jgi:virginiamycin B lyase
MANGGQVGRVTPSGSVTEFPVTDNNPSRITTGPDGNMWFTESNNNAVGRITPSGTVTQIPVPSPGQNYGITAGPDGNVWFTELSAGKVGRVDLR